MLALAYVVRFFGCSMVVPFPVAGSVPLFCPYVFAVSLPLFMLSLCMVACLSDSFCISVWDLSGLFPQNSFLGAIPMLAHRRHVSR